MALPNHFRRLILKVRCRREKKEKQDEKSLYEVIGVERLVVRRGSML
jgi:hypothetical protein